MGKIKEYKGIIILLLIVLGAAFYWYEWRPNQIMKICAKEASGTLATWEQLQSSLYSTSDETVVYNQVYNECKNKNGLEK